MAATASVTVSAFDYSAVPDAAHLRQIAGRIRQSFRKTAEEIVAIGLDLIEAKKALPHGSFLPWLEAEFGMSEWSARNFMRVASRFGGKSEKIPDLPATILYALAAPSTPEEVTETVMERAAQGETVTTETVRTEKAKRPRNSRKAESVTVAPAREEAPPTESAPEPTALAEVRDRWEIGSAVIDPATPPEVIRALCETSALARALVAHAEMSAEELTAFRHFVG